MINQRYLSFFFLKYHIYLYFRIYENGTINEKEEILILLLVDKVIHKNFVIFIFIPLKWLNGGVTFFET